MPEERREPSPDQAAKSVSASEQVATDVPGTAHARELLVEGTRAEELGELESAIAVFTEAARAEDGQLAAEALTRLADARRSLADWDGAIRAARQAQQRVRASENPALAAHAVIAEGNAFMCRGDFEAAKALFQRVLDVTDDARMRGLAMQNLGSMLAQQGQLGAAERAFSESYGYFQRAGYRRGEAIALNNCGRAALDRGDTSLGESLLEQAVDVAREVDHGELIALATLNLAEARMGQANLHDARDLATVALGFFSASANRWRQIECLRLIGNIDERSGDYQAAMASFERGLRLAEEIGAAVEVRSLLECVERIRRDH